MSQNNSTKYANLNLNASLTSKASGQVSGSGPGLVQGASALTKGGLLVLSKVIWLFAAIKIAPHWHASLAFSMSRMG